MTMQNAEPRIHVWLDWEVPRDQLVRALAAAASFYRALPWQGVKDSTPIRAILPGGKRWTLFIVGPARGGGMNAYHEYGGGRLYPPDKTVEDATPSITLSFGTTKGVAEDVLREIREIGGEIAGPAAYPRFHDFGGMNRDFLLDELEEVITLVEAVPRYVKARQQLLGAEGVLARRKNVLTELSWTDDASGVQFEDAKSGE